MSLPSMDLKSLEMLNSCYNTESLMCRTESNRVLLGQKLFQAHAK